MEIRRDFYLDKLIKRKNNGLIKVITGIRRCGESYLTSDFAMQELTSDSLSRPIPMENVILHSVSLLFA